MNGPGEGTPLEAPQRKWLRFGVAIAILHALVLLVIIALLRIDLMLALVVAVSLSIVGGIAVMIVALYVY